MNPTQRIAPQADLSASYRQWLRLQLVAEQSDDLGDGALWGLTMDKMALGARIIETPIRTPQALAVKVEVLADLSDWRMPDQLRVLRDARMFVNG